MAQIKTKFIENNAITNDKVSTGIDATKIGAGDVTNTELSRLNGVSSDIQTQLDNKVDTSQLGANSGVATLNASGKLTNAQIPAIAVTEVFTAADITARDALTIGTGDGEIQEGDVVVVTDASADPNVTSGAASYIYDGTAYQQLQTPDSPVQSVNGATGVVVLNTDDINEGVTNFYYTEARFDTSLSGKSTTDLSEGTNLYYTEARVSANTDVAANTAARHDAVTLAAGDTSDALSLTGQEITSNAATTTTAGHMSSADKSKLDGIEAGATADQTAAEVSYSNATSGLTATDVQAAIDEVEGRLDTTESDVSTNSSDIADRVVGPLSSTDNALVRFDSTTGKLVQDSNAILDDAGAISGLTELTVDNLNLNGNTLSTSTGDITVLSPSSSGGNTTELSNPTNVGGNHFNGNITSFRYAQTFTTTNSFTLSQVDVSVRSTGATGNVIMKIVETTAGAPNATVVATSANSVDLASVGTSFSLQSFTFSGETLSATTQYAYVIEDDGSATTGTLSFETGAAVAGETYYFEDGSWISGGGDDGVYTISSAVFTQGTIILSGGSINASNTKIINVTDPTAAQDAATKAYVDSQVSTSSVPQKEDLTLVAQDITNQYVDLAAVSAADSIMLSVSGIMQVEGSDYTVSLTGGAGGNTRITFAGDLATGGAAALEAGDVLNIAYEA